MSKVLTVTTDPKFPFITHREVDEIYINPKGVTPPSASESAPFAQVRFYRGALQQLPDRTHEPATIDDPNFVAPENDPDAKVPQILDPDDVAPLVDTFVRDADMGSWVQVRIEATDPEYTSIDSAINSLLSALASAADAKTARLKAEAANA